MISINLNQPPRKKPRPIPGLDLHRSSRPGTGALRWVCQWRGDVPIYCNLDPETYLRRTVCQARRGSVSVRYLAEKLEYHLGAYYGTTVHRFLDTYVRVANDRRLGQGWRARTVAQMLVEEAG